MVTGFDASLTRLKQDSSVTTPAGSGSWNCVNDGQAQGTPGSFTVTRFGPTMTVTPRRLDDLPGGLRVRPVTPSDPKLLEGAKGASVKTRCSGTCRGRLSATAVVKGRLAAKALGANSFSSGRGAPRRSR